MTLLKKYNNALDSCNEIKHEFMLLKDNHACCSSTNTSNIVSCSTKTVFDEEVKWMIV